MTSPPEPSPAEATTTAALAVQVAALRGQVRLIFARLDKAGLTGDLNLADRLADLARTVTQALDSPPRGPAAPYWIGLDPAEHAAQLAELRAVGRHRPAPRIRRLPARRLLGQPPARHLGTVHPGRRMAPHLQQQHSPAWTGRWNSTTGGCPAPCAASPTSPAGATPNAPPGGHAPKHGLRLTPFGHQPPPAWGKDPRS